MGAERAIILYIVHVLFFSSSRLYCGGSGAIEKVVVLLFVGVGLTVGNGQCIIGQSLLRKVQSLMIVTLVVSMVSRARKGGRKIVALLPCDHQTGACC